MTEPTVQRLASHRLGFLRVSSPSRTYRARIFRCGMPPLVPPHVIPSSPPPASPSAPEPAGTRAPGRRFCDSASCVPSPRVGFATGISAGTTLHARETGFSVCAPGCTKCAGGAAAESSYGDKGPIYIAKYRRRPSLDSAWGAEHPFPHRATPFWLDSVAASAGFCSRLGLISRLRAGGRGVGTMFERG